MKILFQGDSITDCGRAREDVNSMESGYPALVRAHLGYNEPQKYEFVNRGISGNRIVDVYARIKRDITNLKPDVMSILIGVNERSRRGKILENLRNARRGNKSVAAGPEDHDNGALCPQSAGDAKSVGFF